MDHKEDCFHLGVKALIHNGQGQLLLLQLNSKKCNSHEGDCWDIPGGRIQRNESLEDALRREVYEETALQRIINISPLSMALSRIRIPLQNSDVGLIFAVYVCKLEGNDPICLSDEHVHFAWVKPEKAAQLLKISYPPELTEKIAKLSENPRGSYLK